MKNTIRKSIIHIIAEPGTKNNTISKKIHYYAAKHNNKTLNSFKSEQINYYL